MKTYKTIKSFIYITLSILVFIFRHTLLENVPYLVSFIMTIYGIDILVSLLIKKELFKKPSKFIEMCLLFLLAVIMILVREEFVTVCVIWSIWSILRENGEIEEIVEEAKEGHPFILNSIESIVVIVFSILLILNPHHEHAYSHIILLSIELLCSVLLPHLKYFIHFKKEIKE